MNVIFEPKTLPTKKEAQAYIARLENDLRYNPDATYMDADVLAIVRAYSDGKLVPADKKE